MWASVSSDGPPYTKIGRTPLYAREALDAWVAERLSAPVRNSSKMAR
jgi:hypothetical protein